MRIVSIVAKSQYRWFVPLLSRTSHRAGTDGYIISGEESGVVPSINNKEVGLQDLQGRRAEDKSGMIMTDEENLVICKSMVP